MRKCVWEDSHTSQQLLNVALARIKRFLHVGTTDRLADSVTAAAVRGGGGTFFYVIIDTIFYEASSLSEWPFIIIYYYHLVILFS